jgi:hypothetical protein
MRSCHVHLGCGCIRCRRRPGSRNAPNAPNGGIGLRPHSTSTTTVILLLQICTFVYYCSKHVVVCLLTSQDKLYKVYHMASLLLLVYSLSSWKVQFFGNYEITHTHFSLFCPLVYLLLQKLLKKLLVYVCSNGTSLADSAHSSSGQNCSRFRNILP